MISILIYKLIHISGIGCFMSNRIANELQLYLPYRYFEIVFKDPKYKVKSLRLCEVACVDAE